MLSPYYLVITILNHLFLNLCQKESLFHLLLLPKGTIKSIYEDHEEIIEGKIIEHFLLIYVVRIILKVPPTVHGSLVSIHFHILYDLILFLWNY